jgi:hypothetical protein
MLVGNSLKAVLRRNIIYGTNVDPSSSNNVLGCLPPRCATDDNAIDPDELKKLILKHKATVSGNIV